MKYMIITLCMSCLVLISFTPQRQAGKLLFQEKCGSCHSPNKPLTGPAFQLIRQDYGLEWTAAFIKNNQAMLADGNARALYIYYEYNRTPMNLFPELTKRDIISILDYVDSFPVDSSQYVHRKISHAAKKRHVDSIDNESRRRNQLFRQ